MSYRIVKILDKIDKTEKLLSNSQLRLWSIIPRKNGSFITDSLWLQIMMQSKSISYTIIIFYITLMKTSFAYINDPTTKSE